MMFFSSTCSSSLKLIILKIYVIGDAIGVPDTIMGLTILAAGTSVPDCLASLFVARDGEYSFVYSPVMLSGFPSFHLQYTIMYFPSVSFRFGSTNRSCDASGI